VCVYIAHIHGKCVDAGEELTLRYFFTYIDGYIQTHGVSYGQTLGGHWKDNLEQKM
jgi:hypothetical protein